MTNNNFGIINGRLTKDAEKKTVGDNLTVVELSIASSVYKKDAEYTNYFYTSVFGKPAEGLFSNGKLKKGQFVSLKYHLEQDRWTNAEGKNCSALKIVSENVELAGYPSSSSGKTGDVSAENEASFATSSESSASDFDVY